MNNALIAIGFMLLLFGTLFMLVGIGFSGELKRNGLSFYFEAPDGSPAAMADYVKTNTMRMMLVSWIAILLTSGIISIILGVLGFRVTPEALPPPPQRSLLNRLQRPRPRRRPLRMTIRTLRPQPLSLYLTKAALRHRRKRHRPRNW